MNMISRTRHLFPRQPLSALSKITIVVLLGLSILCSIMSIFSVALRVTTVVVMLCTVLVAVGIRWAPLLGSLLCGYILYVFLIQEAFPVYHLVHPKDAVSSTAISFGLFVIILLLLACAVVALGTGIGATVQNYHTSQPRVTRWLEPTLTGVAGIVVGAILIGALSPDVATRATSSTTVGEPTVHMGISSFAQSSVTVSKGSKLLLVDDGSFPHLLANGRWQDGTPIPANESGAPTVHNVQVSSGSLEIGPFTTAGTYHLYCSIHQGMNLVIIVQ